MKSMRNLCEAYLGALNSGNLDAVLSLFSPGAIVRSPLYGVCSAVEFYTDLFADTGRSETEILNIFDSSISPSVVGLHFRYRWTLASASVVDFECIDVFEINDRGEQFTQLTIIYDTAPLRKDFETYKGAKSLG